LIAPSSDEISTPTARNIDCQLARKPVPLLPEDTLFAEVDGKDAIPFVETNAETNDVAPDCPALATGAATPPACISAPTSVAGATLMTGVSADVVPKRAKSG
jgi:hypothetical protein